MPTTAMPTQKHAPRPEADILAQSQASAEALSTEAAAGSATELIIKPRKGWIAIDWRELFSYRELLYFLVWRDIKVRYKQTVLGFAWAIIQPVFSMVVFTVIFGQFAKIDSLGFPYPVFVYAALLPWTYFSTAVSAAGQSLINQQHLLTKVYFPRLLVPASSVGSALVDLAISFGVYACILAWYGHVPSWTVVFIPLLIVMATCSSLGLGLIMAALTVSYRDFRHVLPFMIQVLMYLSPVVYATDMIPAQYRWLYALNPLTGVIDGFRSSLLNRPWDLQTLAISSAVSVGLFLFGLAYFRRTERRFADIA